MPWVAAAAAAAAAVAGGAMQANATKKAAAEQGRAAERSLEEERRQFDLAREDLAPYRDAGGRAVNRLSDLLGLGTGQSLVPQTSTPSSATVAGTTSFDGPLVDTAGGVPTYNRALYQSDPIYKAAWDAHLANHIAQYGKGYDQSSNADALALGLRDLMSKQRQEQGLPTVEQEVAATLADAREDPTYGLLTRRFTMEDLNADPVYNTSLQFGMDEGQKAIERRFKALGLNRSGAAAKAITRFATDYGGTKAGESYNRFNADMDRLYNRLAGVSGTGQTATTSTATLGAGSTARSGELITGAANARGAAAIAGSNAYANALNNVAGGVGRALILDDYNSRSGGGSGGYGSYTPTFTLDNAYENTA